MDISEVFRGGGRSVEFLDQINKASLVMLDEAGIVPHPIARRIASGIAQLIAKERGSPPHSSLASNDARVAGEDLINH